MTSLTGTLVFLSLIIFSLTVVSVVNRIQTRNRLIRQKCYQLKRRIDDLEELCGALEPLLESMLIPRLINEEVLDLIRSLEQLDPETPSIEVKRANAEEAAKALGSGQRAQPLCRVQSTDAAVIRKQSCLTDAARVVRRHQGLGRLDTTELDSYIRELAWAHLMVETVTLVAEGHRAVNRDDPMAAYRHYRRAQSVLMGASIADPRRHRFIKEIGAILAGEQLAISEELMPESQFNPTRKPDFSKSAEDLSGVTQLAVGGYEEP